MNNPRSVLIAALAALCCLAGCNRNRPQEEDEKSPAPAALVPVRVGALERGDIPANRLITGRTDVLRREKILAPTAGTIVSLKILEYQQVHAGDVLVVILTKESQAAIDGSRALMQSAATDRQKAEAEKAMKLASGSQSSSVVRATMDGIASERVATEGEFVSENSEILTIIDPATVYFSGRLPIGDAALVRTGQACVVRFPAIATAAFPGTVDAISPQSDLQSQTVGLRISFGSLPPASRGLLRPEMAGTATITTGVRHNALIAPASALIRNDETDSYSITVLLPDSLSRTVPVVVGERTDSTAEVAGEGLREGMAVVTEGNYALPDSTRVTTARGPE